MNSKIVFLTNSFYQDHPNPPFKEMEQKQNRPYIVFLVEIEGHTWAIPFRSHIRHGYAFFTDAENKCGIDYSKAVVVDRPELYRSTGASTLAPERISGSSRK